MEGQKTQMVHNVKEDSGMIDFLLQDKVLFSVAPLLALGITLILSEITNYLQERKNMKYHGEKIDWTRAIGLIFLISLSASAAYYFFSGIYGLAVRLITAIGGLW